MIDTICASLNVYELCGTVRGAIEDKFGYDEIIEEEVDIPHELKVIFYVEMCEGFARCNGFDSLLCMYCDHTFLEKAYREIGQDDQSDLLGEVFQSFPKEDSYQGYHLPFVDWPSYEDYTKDRPEFQKKIKAFDNRFFEVAQEKVEQNLSRYIRIHRTQLESILDDLKTQHDFALVEQRN
ncbi:MAG: hypothetical protein MI807_03640 [Verrucomicrobiales bacterium]|nr:hypothetical protein [Verrucomicrobiales bacterium]